MKDYILKNTLDVMGLARTKENLQALKQSLRPLQAQGPPKMNLAPEDLNPTLQMTFHFA